jgi:hypothetical protein
MLRATFRVYRRGFVALLIVAGVAAILDACATSAYTVLSDYATSALDAGQPREARAASLLVSMLSLLAFGGFGLVAEAVIGGIAIVIASNTVLHRPADLVGACGLAARRLGRLVLVVGLSRLVMIVLAVTVLGIPFAIYAGLGWMLASQIVLLEGLGWRDALRRSWDMVRWHRRFLLASYRMVSLVETIVYGVPACLLAYASGGSVAITACAVPADAPLLVWLGDTVLRGLSSALIQPLVPILTTLLYYDFRVDDERLDLDLRAAVSDRQPAA